jgi:hypothetical protein
MTTSKITKSISLLFAIVIALSNASCTYNDSGHTTIHSDTYIKIINYDEWRFVENGHWYIRIQMPNISKSVIDNGAVLVYFKDYTTNNWILLPYSTTFYNEYNQQFSEEIWFGYALGTLDIDYVYTNPNNMTPRQFLELKIVVIKL